MVMEVARSIWRTLRGKPTPAQETNASLEQLLASGSNPQTTAVELFAARQPRPPLGVRRRSRVGLELRDDEGHTLMLAPREFS